MGCEVVVAGGDPAAVAAVLERWEAAFSLFRPESELSRVNRVAGACPRRVAALRARARGGARVAAETDGLVDPTLCGRWPRSRSRRPAALPPARLALDLNGVVKALAVDAAAATLDGPGFVSVGGDLAVRGRWTSALPAGGAIRVVDGRPGHERDASRGAHLVDSATGCAERIAVGAGHGVRRELSRRRRRREGRLPARRPRARRGSTSVAIPGRFVGLDGEIVENGAWAGATQAVPACT